MRTAGQKKRRIFQRVEIVDTADEGLAIGRCEDGMIILVKGAVPGDTVDAVALEKRKGMFITKVESISTFSSDRTDPFCSHFGTCGGCKWQHMAYGAQLRFKEKKGTRCISTHWWIRCIVDQAYCRCTSRNLLPE